MKILRRLSLFLTSLSLLSLGQLHAQVGADNPTGPYGIFNGNVTTGCSYDPYTGNLSRSIIDMEIAGGVGKYQLALGRTYNSRNAFGVSFGVSGWRHSYEWALGDSPVSITQNANPVSYSVTFPDGRHEVFAYSASDIYYRAAAGVRERFQPLNLSTMLAYLVLPDGGKVEFRATQVSYLDQCCPQDGCGQCTFYYYSYAAQAIIDPHGLRTSLTYNTDGTLYRVTEPAGRYIQFHWVQVSGYKVIDYITASDGRSVNYYYTNISPGGTVYTALDHIIYYGSASWTAHYQYCAPNVPPAYGVPLLSTADDPMYSGPMKRIAYTYKTGTNPDNSSAVFGQIQSENYYDGTNVGVAVTTLTVTGTNTRTETRGDGQTRTFTYSTGYLTSWTDFYNHSASQTYDTNNYINSVTDRNGHTTNFTSNALTGLATQIQYPLTTGDTPGQTTRPTVNYTYVNDYYLSSSQDEGGHTTTFTRDPTTHRITQVNYPDGGYETFTYNSFGEVLNHRITTGGTETFTYDARGLRLTYRNPSNATGNPTARYQYDALDRVSGVTDALGTALGDVNHTTGFSYNARGQVTVTTHPTDPVDGQRHTITNAYNPDGTLQSKTNELGAVTSYTYDDYRRVKSVTPPARGDGTGLHTTHFYYDANGAGDDYRYTDSSVTYVILPSGKPTKTTYDGNRHKLSVTVGLRTGYGATTSYGYDNVGNVTSVVAPNEQAGQQYAGKSTTTTYDQRNRPSSIRDALLNTTTFTYDTAGRKQSVSRPNGQTITYDSYDAMNRLLQQTATQAPIHQR